MGAYEFEAVGDRFQAGLSGRNEVPPVSTLARGRARFLLRGDETRLGFSLDLTDIQEATDGHIHCGLAGETGPVGATLFSGASFSGRGRFSGRITAPDAGNGCGWAELADLVYAVRIGHAYVNVHTVVYPGGEIRGQVMPVLGP